MNLWDKLPSLAPPPAFPLPNNPCWPYYWPPPYFYPTAPQPGGFQPTQPAPGGFVPGPGQQRPPAPSGGFQPGTPSGGFQPSGSSAYSPNPKRKRFVGGPTLLNAATSQKEKHQDVPEIVWAYSDISDGGYPWPAATLNKHNYPTPGMFFDANNPEGAFVFQNMDGFVKAALGSALVMADANTSLATVNTDTGRRLRKQMRDLIQSSQFNDGLCGISCAESPGPHGRGISWTPKHADVFSLLAQGETPMRTVDGEDRRLPQFLEANSLPLVWVPAVNLSALQSRDPQIVPLLWSDGVSTQEPPAAVRKLGVSLSDVVLPGGVGCAQSMRMPNTGRRGNGNAQMFWHQQQQQHGKGKKRPPPPPPQPVSIPAPLLLPQF